MSGPAYAPPVVYQQGSYPYSSGTQQLYSASAGWMSASPGQAPYQQPYPQQQQQPYPQQQPYLQQHQPYPQQQQSYSQQQPSVSTDRYGQNSMNQHFSNPSPYQLPTGMGVPPANNAALYMAPATYNPNPQGAGRKKALLIGCCYPGTSSALNGCINDVQCIEYCLKHRFGYSQPGSIVVLRDDQRHPDYVSTRANILRGIQWLMQDQRPGDSLFFHFSGHGSQQADWTGDELDGQDETILPTDYKRAGMIVDDELNALLVRPLMPGVTLHALIDACHSGTAMDLPYRAKYGTDGRFAWKLKTRTIKGTSGGTAFQLGACKDSQVAADTNSMSGSAYTGAATFSFIDAVERYGPQQTYASLLQHMMETLRKQSAGAAGPASLAIPGLGGGLSGIAVGMMASFLLGGAALGGQVPVICCDKQVDLYNICLRI
eukprot:GHRR01001361.1.p1 GENE.GHRR01001361.1~~GHRR01001361.1.p1  ORF type:complete len:431 (+),score=130.21 GHRR01001361.1:238-1530(+)